jgi:hypothetical protein
MANEGQRKRHFLLRNNAQSEPFKSPPRRGGGATIPGRDRQAHGNALLAQVQQLAPQLGAAKVEQQQAGLEEGFGLQIECQSFPDIELAFESLDRKPSGIELRNVRHEDEQTFATVFIPEGKLRIFENLIKAYLDEGKDKTKKLEDGHEITVPKNSNLLNAIADIRAATLEALWTDDIGALPQSDDETLWWEVWLPVRGERTTVVEQFREVAEGLNFRLAPGELQFPERTVLLVYGSAGQMKRSIIALNSIAELRRAKETADFFDALPPDEQPPWLDDLLDRLTFPEPGDAVPHVCVLDTGINNGHPLIAPAPTDIA